MKKSVLASLVAAGALGFMTAGVSATEDFATLNGVAAKPMTGAQMAQVEGKAHIFLLVDSKVGDLPDQAEMATRAAAPTPQGGDFARSPSRDAAAFDFLN